MSFNISETLLTSSSSNSHNFLTSPSIKNHDAGQRLAIKKRDILKVLLYNSFT